MLIKIFVNAYIFTGFFGFLLPTFYLDSLFGLLRVISKMGIKIADLHCPP
ncbi:MAG: hypothetical protein LBO06_06355 [Bacteroidales bacterium]|nr:hypothetical protein [Bacteroidales bacterium]